MYLMQASSNKVKKANPLETNTFNNAIRLKKDERFAKI